MRIAGASWSRRNIGPYRERSVTLRLLGCLRDTPVTASRNAVTLGICWRFHLVVTSCVTALRRRLRPSKPTSAVTICTGPSWPQITRGNSWREGSLVTLEKSWVDLVDLVDEGEVDDVHC